MGSHQKILSVLPEQLEPHPHNQANQDEERGLRRIHFNRLRTAPYADRNVKDC